MIQNLHSGIFYIPNALSKEFKEKTFSWYENNAHLFYIPKLKTGHSMKLKMLCMGKHWNPIDYKYYNYRADFDQLQVPEIPLWMLETADQFCRKLYPSHAAGLDICIANAYTGNNRLGIHQDKDESHASIASGYPVISFSFGFTADFVYKLDYKMYSIKLQDGDVFSFGDENRLLYHGINKIYAANKPPFTYNRINLTFRKF